jgi:hypothetical protein
MAEYGQMIESYDPNLDVMYMAFAEYFNNPTMTKIKDVEKFSVYMSKTYCLLSRECRYLIAFINKDGRGIGTLEELKTMAWISFQTRTLPDKHELLPHSYTAKRGGSLDVEINRIKTGEKASTYTCSKLPITLTLLHPKKGSNYYQDKGSVIAALETYQTIININES